MGSHNVDEVVEKYERHIWFLECLQKGILRRAFPCSVFLQEPDQILELLHTHFFLPYWRCCKLWIVAVELD